MGFIIGFILGVVACRLNDKYGYVSKNIDKIKKMIKGKK